MQEYRIKWDKRLLDDKEYSHVALSRLYDELGEGFIGTRYDNETLTMYIQVNDSVQVDIQHIESILAAAAKIELQLVRDGANWYVQPTEGIVMSDPRWRLCAVPIPDGSAIPADPYEYRFYGRCQEGVLEDNTLQVFPNNTHNLVVEFYDASPPYAYGYIVVESTFDPFEVDDA